MLALRIEMAGSGAAKSLSKVQKHIQKRKGKSTALNENSRDSKRLRRAVGRDDKLKKQANAKARQSQSYCVQSRRSEFSTICIDIRI